MQRDKTSKNLLNTTELTCVLPLRQGFVNVVDTRTFATRVRIVMRVLNGLRKSSRELREVRPIADIVDAIGTIHAFTLTVINHDQQLLLSVTFDRPWEPYMRIIWRDLGPLLDLLLCNCAGFDGHSSDHGFDAFTGYVRKHQVETDLFYTSSAVTQDDVRYLTQLERAQRDGSKTLDLDAARLVVDDVREKAREAAKRFPKEAIEQGLAALHVLHGLRSLHPDKPDSVFLRRAACALLRIFVEDEDLGEALTARAPEMMKWLSEPDALPAVPDRKPPADHEIQGGILTTYRRVSHGALILLRIVDPVKARATLDLWREQVTVHNGPGQLGVFVNIAFTYGGLRRLGVPQADLDRLPKEFRDGMEARAGLIGDVRMNHPDNWTLPEWNWPPKGDRRPAVRMSTIDIVVDFRMRENWSGGDDWSEQFPLFEAIRDFMKDKESGIQLMSVQPLRHHYRHYPDTGKHRVVDHFGFVDGLSQPSVAPVPSTVWDDHVPLGELLLGHTNLRSDPPIPDTDPPSLLLNGSFLVVRKLRQDVAAFQAALKAFEDQEARVDLAAKLMGRTKDGIPLAAPEVKGPIFNDFNYQNDKKGDGCPFHSHIRRANPRTQEQPAAKIGLPGRDPRIARRGMSYGTEFSNETADADRGLMFMAYNASIAEQFEIIQRWMTGGNSTGGFSGQADPFLRVPEGGDSDTFRFLHEGEAKRAKLDKPFVTLQWGLYLFTPSMAALAAIARGPAKAPSDDDMVRLGEETIARLKTAEQWSAVLEDVSANHGGLTSAVYAAIRKNHGGVLKTPYGVLVASEAMARTVLRNDADYSVSEYATRLKASIGMIYLGMDKSDPQYHEQSKDPNNAIRTLVSPAQAFQTAREGSERFLKAISAAQPGRFKTFSLDELVERVLATTSKAWLDIPDEKFVKGAGRPTPADPAARCPFSFLAPSRYVFSSPNPRQAVTDAGQADGRLATQSVTRFVAALKEAGTSPDGPLSGRLFAKISDTDLLARSLVGVMEGFLPTIHGNFLKTLNLWIGDESLWRLQEDLLSTEGDGYARAVAVLTRPLMRALQTRPIPDMIYRTVTQGPDRILGPVTVTTGDRVVICIASTTHELLARNVTDVSLVFGRTQPLLPEDMMGELVEEPETGATHACPGYHLGFAALLGMISAILEAGVLRPRPHPFLVLEHVERGTAVSPSVVSV